MVIIISIFAIATCFCTYYAYHTWIDARINLDRAEQFLRTANERLYAADQAEHRIRQEINKRNGPGAKILPFNRHLKSIPPEDTGPNNAA